MPHSRFTNEEIVRRGEEIYEQKIRAKVEDGNKGKFLVIDIETGGYELGDDYQPLLERLHAKHADAALYIKRVGYTAAARIGGGFTVSKR